MKGVRERPEAKAKKISVENAKFLESLPEPPEFEAYESPFIAHRASPILPSEFSSNPEPLALFNLFFGNDILAQIITNTNRYAEIKQQRAESHQGPSVSTSSFIPAPASASSPILPSILHPKLIPHI